MNNTPKIKPILFSTEMVKALLDGRKTQTRRIIKPQPWLYTDNSFIDKCDYKNGNFCLKHKISDNPEKYEITDLMKSKYQVGDILWVRETWQQKSEKATELFGAEKYYYKAGCTGCTDTGWKPSIFMPKAACRIFLEVTDVRIEKLQDISEADAIAEGIQPFGNNLYKDYSNPKIVPEGLPPFWSFNSLWCSINGPSSWEANPFVFVYEFKKVERPSNFLNS